jgi:hypothetical protein
MTIATNHEEFSRTLLELERRFSTEQTCREYLFDLRWPDDSIPVTCILCRETRVYLPTEVGLDFPHHEFAKRVR